MQQPVAKFLLMLASALAAPAAFAQDLAPDALLRSVSAGVIDKIKQDQDLRAASADASINRNFATGCCISLPQHGRSSDKRVKRALPQATQMARFGIAETRVDPG